MDEKTEKLVENENIADPKEFIPKNRFFVISYGVFGLTVLVLGIIALIITGAYPCVHTKCNANATCYNTPFYADCVCNHGFAGDGRDHCDECGISYFKNNANDFGARAIPYSWPATGILEFTYTSLEKFETKRVLIYEYDMCGVVLINRKTALTAAHCIRTKYQYYDFFYAKNFQINVTFNNFHPNWESMYSLYFGSDAYVDYYADLPHVQLADVEQVIIHPEYDENTYQNNIAIIKFYDEIELNRYVQIACLPKATTNDFPRLSDIKGFISGYSSSGNSYIDWNLYNVALDLYNTSMCLNVQPEKSKNWDKQFCAGEYNEHGNETAKCHGDYGSPLYVQDKVNGKTKFVASGLLSYDVPCNTRHAPGVYTRISSYFDWIQKNSKY